MTKPALSPIEKRDLQLLSYLAQHDIKDASQRFRKSEGALNSELYRIRLRVMRAEEYLRQVRHLRHIGGSRIVKLTSSSKIQKKRLNDEEDDLE